MNILIPTRRYDERMREMMDDPAADASMLRDELKNLRRINRYFGGLSTIRRSVFSLLQSVPDKREIQILDLGTGSADLPIHLVECAEKLHRTLRITAVEQNPVVLEVAQERSKHIASITVEHGDLLALKYAPGSFDIVLCSLTLHHFSDTQVQRVLRTMYDLSRIGFIVNDLHRSWVAAWTAKLYSVLTTRNPMTIYDSYLSVLRGFTPGEFASLARAAGIQEFDIQPRPFFRILLIGKH